MRVAARTILLPLDALRMQALVLRGEVVPILTLAARENDFVSRHFNYRVEGSELTVERRCAALRAARAFGAAKAFDGVAFKKAARRAALRTLHPQPSIP